jgi:hypothetical protein
LQEFLSRLEAFPAPLAIRQAAALRDLRTGPPASPPGPETARNLEAFADWFRAWLPAVKRECSDA